MDTLRQTKVVLKTDGGPALIAVQEAVARSRSHDTLCENPPARDPQANGEAERVIREVEAQMRVVKIGLETRIGHKSTPSGQCSSG